MAAAAAEAGTDGGGGGGRQTTEAAHVRRGRKFSLSRKRGKGGKCEKNEGERGIFIGFTIAGSSPPGLIPPGIVLPA